MNYLAWLVFKYSVCYLCCVISFLWLFFPSLLEWFPNPKKDLSRQSHNYFWPEYKFVEVLLTFSLSVNISANKILVIWTTTITRKTAEHAIDAHSFFLNILWGLQLSANFNKELWNNWLMPYSKSKSETAFRSIFVSSYQWSKPCLLEQTVYFWGIYLT